MVPRRHAIAAGVGLAAVLTGGCIHAPRTVSVYDPDCRAVSRHMVLDAQQVAALTHCANEGCLTLLAAMGAVSAVSAVISGSVVVVGNVMYWFEKRSSCRPAAPDTPAGALPAATPPPTSMPAD